MRRVSGGSLHRIVADQVRTQARNFFGKRNVFLVIVTVKRGRVRRRVVENEDLSHRPGYFTCSRGELLYAEFQGSTGPIVARFGSILRGARTEVWRGGIHEHTFHFRPEIVESGQGLRREYRSCAGGAAVVAAAVCAHGHRSRGYRRYRRFVETADRRSSFIRTGSYSGGLARSRGRVSCFRSGRV